MKIFNIGKANAELERIQKELEEAKAENQSLKENASAIEKAAEAEKARADKAEADAKESQSRAESAAKLLQDQAAKLADFEAKLKAANDTISNPAGEIETRAAAKAQAIMASLGVPPVAAGAQPNLSGNKFGELVKAQMAQGKSKGEAVAYCVKNHNAEYMEWRKSGNTATL